jgi:alkylation response protein AidB-like acyl-CoA dehydrogenase
MHIALDDAGRALRDTTAAVLADLCPTVAVRAAWADDTGLSRDRWHRLAGVGLTSLTLPAHLGGLEASDIDLVPLLEEVGYVALPEPLADAATGATLLAEVAPDVAHRWLPGLVAGEVTLTSGGLGSPYVDHAESVDVVVLASGDAVHVIEAGAAGWVRQPSIDGGRRPARWAAALPAPVGRDAAAVARATDRATLHRAAMLVGLGRRCLDLSVAYARERRQFGRPIGAYQSLRHRMADDWTALEFARPLVWRAAWSTAHRHPDAQHHVSMAKAAANDAAVAASRTAVQVHGAMGYTFECDVQLFLKRILALSASHGDSRFHRRRLADALRVRDIERIPS